MRRVFNSFTAASVLAATVAFAGAAAAATVTPVSYTFDQMTDCGEYCYRDAGVFTPNFTAEPQTPYGELTDGVLGYAGWFVDGATPWVGWTDALVNIDFKFADAVEISRVRVGTTQDALDDVVLPNLRVFSSDDGADWTLRGTLLTPPSAANNRAYTSTAPHVFLTLGNLNFTSSYVRVEVSNQGRGYGGFSFLDEVQFQTGVPEPETWALMIAGFGLVGASFRRRRLAL